MAKMIVFMIIITFEILYYNVASGTITSVSSIKGCINDGSGDLLKQENGTSCQKKLVVAMTIDANEGKSQFIEANIRQVHDSTTSQNLELKTPVRVTVTKSPVIINYRLYQLGYVNSRPYEEIRKKKGKRCRDDWFSKNSEAACGFQQDTNGDDIFDSQGFCCKCDLKGTRYDRGEGVNCKGDKMTAHCLTFDELYMYVFGLYPPTLQFDIGIKIEKVAYNLKDGGPVYEVVEQLTIEPSQRTANSDQFTIRVEYIADFYPSTFLPVLNHKYLMIPDLKNMNDDWFDYASGTDYDKSVQNASEWLLVDKHLFEFSGLHCNKIGVSYTPFRNQEDRCASRAQSCVQGQPYDLWKEDYERQKSNQKPLYQLHSFGRVHSIPHSSGMTNYQINFIADRTQRSFITVSMEADSFKVVINKSPGRIVEAYIDPFEALSIDGQLDVFVQNIGGITATYNVLVSHCSGGIDFVPSKAVTLDPGEETNVTFIIHSFHSLGQINNCEVELLDQTADVLDNLTIVFETLDTCFCYGYCGCSCGNNVSDCPPKPVFQKPDTFRNVNYFSFGSLSFNADFLKKLESLAFWVAGGLGAFYITGLIVLSLIGLGVLKVLLILQTGQLNLQHFYNPCKIAAIIAREVYSKFIENCSIFTFCILKSAKGAKGKIKEVGIKKSSGKRPKNCDGTCHGAKRVRRNHRKKLRLMKRKGLKIDKIGPWWEKPYECTCVIKETKDVIEICKGLFFFLYCPFLPVWWSIELSYEWILGRRRRMKRKREFRARKEKREKEPENAYLLLDKYTRGTTEKKVVDFEIEKMTKKNTKEKEKNDTMKALEEGTLLRFSSDEELGLDSSDTTATDEAYDLDELTDPGYPVYMNYAGAKSSVIPKSLKNPGKQFSIKGRLIEKQMDGGVKMYTFDLYKYTKQVKTQKDKSLKPPNELNPNEFKQSLQLNVLQLLITLSPLFTCLNK